MFRHNLQKRVVDLQKTVAAAKAELKILDHMKRNLVSDRELETLDLLNDYSNNLQDVVGEAEATACTNSILSALISGLLAFEILDRFTGTWSVTLPASTEGLEPFFNTPYLWMLLSIILWAAFRRGYSYYMVEKQQVVGMVNNCNLIMDEKILDFKAFDTYLQSKEAIKESMIDEGPTVSSHYWYCWTEKDAKNWPGGIPPTITLEYDWKQEILLTLNAQLPRTALSMTPEALKNDILAELRYIGAIKQDEDDEEEQEEEEL